MQKDRLARLIEAEQVMATIPPLSAQLMQLVGQHGRVTIRQATQLTDANRNTIKLHLRQLVAARHLRRCGRGRGTWYERG